MIGRAVNAVLARFDRRLQCGSTFDLVEQQRRALLALYTNAAAPRAIERGAPLIEGIVFSKDRPLQLHALLDSYLRHARTPAPLRVLFKASTAEQQRAYAEVFALFPAALVTAHAERHFRDDLRELLASIRAERLLFLVDDIIFLEPFAFEELCQWDWLRFIPTLRLGRGIDYCYTRSVAQMEPPWRGDVVRDERFVAWRWSEGQHEYAFPLSLDGHVFNRDEMAIIAAHSDFAGPNTFETILQLYLDAFAGRIAIAYAKARLVNVPWNKVQAEWDSRHAGIDGASLLKAWNDRMQVDTAHLAGYRNRSTHEELPLKLIPRGSSVLA